MTDVAATIRSYDLFTPEAIRDPMALLRRMRAEPEWGSMPGRSWDTTTWVADNRKARAELGWQPRHTLEEGIALMARWLDAHPAMLRRYTA